MPGKVKVKIAAGRNLPVMDRSNDTTDAYVEVKLGNTTYKTDVCRKSLHPQWNSEWFRFEMDDLELQDEPLQIRLMDHDTYSANDAIGKVYLDLNPLLMNSSKDSSGRLISGWIPVYDTMHGIRGEVNLVVKVELFSDLNKYRQSSCGVKFFFTQEIPEGHVAYAIHGFVEELVVNDDPEYQWIDKIRTPRASNEARQTLFSKLSGEVQRRVGLKALELGGNSVIGYRQCFDLEGESGIVVRGIGTAITLSKHYESQVSPCSAHLDTREAVREAEGGRSWVRAPATSQSMPDTVLRGVRSSGRLPPVDFSLHPRCYSSSASIPSSPLLLSSDSPFRVLLGRPSPSPVHDSFPRRFTPHDSLPSLSSKPPDGSESGGDDDPNAYLHFKAPIGRSESPDKADPEEDESTKSNFNILRRKKGSRKKDRYSKSSLLKRAHTVLEETASAAVGENSKGRKELFGFFLRRKKKLPRLPDPLTDGDKENEGEKKGACVGGRYRSATDSVVRRFLFRKRSRFSGSIQRSNSESFSIGANSLDSLPSIRSELVFEADEGQSLVATDSNSNSTSEGRKGWFHSREPSSCSSVPSCEVSGEGRSTSPPTVVHSTPPDTPSGVLGVIRELGFGTDQSLRLYISSMNALLVYEPPTEDVGEEMGGSTNTSTTTAVTTNTTKPEWPSSSTNSSTNSVFTHPALSSSLGGRRRPGKRVGWPPFPPAISRRAHGRSEGGRGAGWAKGLHPTNPPPPAGLHNNNTLTMYNLNSQPGEGRSCHEFEPSPSHRRSPIPEELSERPAQNGSAGKAGCVAGPTTTKGGAGHHHHGKGPKPPTSSSSSSSNPSSAHGNAINRRSSESDLSTPPKAIMTTGGPNVSGPAHTKTLTFSSAHRPAMSADHFDILEYPFITLTQLPPGFVLHFGGTVSARSVKLLERISNLDDPESRDSWWTEIRMEIRSHARSIGCNVILGYEEQTTMCDDVCVLSASGTAAIVSSSNFESSETKHADYSHSVGKERKSYQPNGMKIGGGIKIRHYSDGTDVPCSVCHIPYNESSVPFPVKMTRCGICKKGRVPDLLLVTVDLPRGIGVVGKSCLIQAQVFRPKKDAKGEASAKEVSDSLPFLEYELHRRLINKLKVKGMNAIFSLQVQICLGDRLIVGVATGTALFLAALPVPSVPIITAGNMKTDAQKVLQFQKVIQETYERNRDLYELKNVSRSQSTRSAEKSIDGESGEFSDEELTEIDLATGNKDTFVLEVDDAEDIEIISALIDPTPPFGIDMNNIDSLHGFNDCALLKQQMFTQVFRCRVPGMTLRQFTNYFEKLVRSVAFKLRRIKPLVLHKLRFRVELPEQDEMQLSIIGMALGFNNLKIKNEDIENGIFTIESDSHSLSPQPGTSAYSNNGTSNFAVTLTPAITIVGNSPGQSNVTQNPFSKSNPILLNSNVRMFSKISSSGKGRYTVEVTPCAHFPGAKIEKYLGNLNFFFIRETTSIRENGGLSGFVNNFIAEILAIVRAHVAALGGNGMVSYFMTELSLLHNPHKNQAQALINIGGDVVYFTENQKALVSSQTSDDPSQA